MPVDVFLIDTNVISNSIKAKPNPVVTAWMLAQETIAIPFPVFLEVERGIAERRRTDPSRADALSAWFDDVQAAKFLYPESTPEVARLLGSMMSCRPLSHLWTGVSSYKGRKPGQDLFIAAIAICHDLPIATMDQRDFGLINDYYALPGVFNPAAGTWDVLPGDGPAGGGRGSEVA